MKILVDMNLAPSWIPVLCGAGFDAVHWSAIGSPDAPDSELFAWAREHGYLVFTHDLDFGAMLAATRAESPSVFQIRTQDVTPAALSFRAITLLRRFEHELQNGALIVVDELRERIRFLPLGAP